jgi:hypothetical protein|tara:strand:- start:164 stop:526 length:363 start_codon:yes stop_codon:yes gene_type:complete
MGDNDFPAVMANGGEFLQGYTKKKGLIQQEETGQPPRGAMFESEQVLGGPELTRVSATDEELLAAMPRYIRGHQYAPRGVIMTVPDIDSRIFNERVKRGYVPMTPPPARGAGGPQLPGFI